MTARILAIARWGLLIWRAIVLVAVVIFAVIFTTAFSSFASSAPAKIHSYVSSRAFTGDYLDAYAIKISRVEVTELTKGMRLTNKCAELGASGASARIFQTNSAP